MARRFVEMQNRRGGLAVIVILALVLVILALTNPTKDDFARFLAGKARSQVGDKGVFTEFAKGVAGAGGEFSSRAYYRQNFLVFSLFKLYSNDRTDFIGFGKYVFIRTAR